MKLLLLYLLIASFVVLAHLGDRRSTKAEAERIEQRVGELQFLPARRILNERQPLAVIRQGDAVAARVGPAGQPARNVRGA